MGSETPDGRDGQLNEKDAGQKSQPPTTGAELGDVEQGTAQTKVAPADVQLTVDTEKQLTDGAQVQAANAQGSGAHLAASSQKLKADFVVFFKQMGAAPWVWIIPLFVMIGFVIAGELGVWAAAQDYETQRHDIASGQVVASAQQVNLALQTLNNPNIALAAAVKASPYVPVLAQQFAPIAADILKKSDTTGFVQRIQIIPWGIISGVYPYDTPDNVATLAYNFFTDPARANITRDAVALGPDYLDIIGPITLIDKTQGFVSRMILFMPNITSLNETFGMDTPFTVPYAPQKKLGNATDPTKLMCGPTCGMMTINGTVWRFWGILNAVVRSHPIKAPLAALESQSVPYKHILFRKVDAVAASFSQSFQLSEYYQLGSSTIIFKSDNYSQITAADNPECTDIRVTSGASLVWTLCIVPIDGWGASWLVPLQIAIAFMAVIFGLLLFFMLYNMNRAKLLLTEQVALNTDLATTNNRLAETTRVLEEEKQRRDALLSRQLELISCFAQQGGSTLTMDASVSKEVMTMARIESERRAMNPGSGAQAKEEMTMMELLGEGTFGKVYKGLWRGTLVAIKTMILPANMSGQEKREKMAIMEAAISSTMAHPNIVQTYTYSIRPIKDAAPEEGGEEGSTGEGATSASAAKGATNMSVGMSINQPGGGSVHSYEVRLVCEFCDKGCLRDALDQGAFRTVGGINYAAVLDTAADIAKAMLHLHINNVLHSDLKARNVMMSGASNEGRGVRCKVADFGLAVRIDHNETHMSGMFQGTLTHMAPEIMLEGRVSKAADVYAFGITLWELYTSARAFQGVPRLLLGHQITREHRRPAFPASVPAAYKDLTDRCWHPSPDKRPTFNEILDTLLSLRSAIPGLTEALAPVHIPAPGAAAAAAGGAASTAAATGGESHGMSMTYGDSVTMDASSMDAGMLMGRQIGAKAGKQAYDEGDSMASGTYDDDGSSGFGWGAPLPLATVNPGPAMDVIEEETEVGTSSIAH